MPRPRGEVGEEGEAGTPWAGGIGGRGGRGIEGEGGGGGGGGGRGGYQNNGGSNGNGSKSIASSWQIIGVALALIGQTWLIASKTGTLDADVQSANRRIGVIETTGSPSLQGLRTEVAINTREVDSLKNQIGDRLNSLQVQVSSIKARQDDALEEVQRLRNNRASVDPTIATLNSKVAAFGEVLEHSRAAMVAHDKEDRDVAIRMGAIEGKLAALCKETGKC